MMKMFCNEFPAFISISIYKACNFYILLKFVKFWTICCMQYIDKNNDLMGKSLYS